MKTLAVCLGSLAAVIGLVVGWSSQSTSAGAPANTTPSRAPSRTAAGTARGASIQRQELSSDGLAQWWHTPQTAQSVAYRFAVEASTELHRGTKTYLMTHRWTGLLDWSCCSRDAEATILALSFADVAWSWQLGRNPQGSCDSPIGTVLVRVDHDGKIELHLAPETTMHERLLVREIVPLFTRASGMLTECHDPATSRRDTFVIDGTDMQFVSSAEASASFASFAGSRAAQGCEPASLTWEDFGSRDEVALLLDQLELMDSSDQLSGVTLQQLLQAASDALHSQQAHELVNAQQMIATHLRFHPGDLERVRDLVLTSQLGHDVSGVVLRAAADAQTDQSQQLLVGLLEDPRLDAALTLQVLTAATEMRTPSAALVDALARICRNRCTSRRLALQALHALGAMATRPGQHQAEAAAHLTALESVATGDGLLTPWLEAIAAISPGQAIAACGRHLSNADARVRALAVAALRDAEADAALSLLSPVLHGDPAAFVRARAAEIVANHASPAAVHILTEVLASDVDDAVREAVIVAIGRDQDRSADARRLLEWAASSDPSAGVRTMANELLASAGSDTALPH